MRPHTLGLPLWWIPRFSNRSRISAIGIYSCGRVADIMVCSFPPRVTLISGRSSGGVIRISVPRNLAISERACVIFVFSRFSTIFSSDSRKFLIFSRIILQSSLLPMTPTRKSSAYRTYCIRLYEVSPTARVVRFSFRAISSWPFRAYRFHSGLILAFFPLL